jgi:hypothetical protein
LSDITKEKKMVQRSGNIIIKFVEDLSEEMEKSIISEIYRRNRKYIGGMEYSGFEDTKPVSTIKSFIKSKFESNITRRREK